MELPRQLGSTTDCSGFGLLGGGRCVTWTSCPRAWSTGCVCAMAATVTVRGSVLWEVLRCTVPAAGVQTQGTHLSEGPFTKEYNYDFFLEKLRTLLDQTTEASL